jgi:hypothetical protein
MQEALPLLNPALRALLVGKLFEIGQPSGFANKVGTVLCIIMTDASFA